MIIVSFFLFNITRNGFNDFISDNNHVSFFCNCREFSNRCKITEKSSTVQTDSVGTTIPTAEEELFPSYICTLGDDFMRHFFSFELYGSDFTEQDGK